MHHGAERTLTNMKDNQVGEEPKEEEKPSLFLSIDNRTYPIILHFRVKKQHVS